MSTYIFTESRDYMIDMFERFDNLVKQRKLKYSDVSKGTGISYSTFTDWKKGRYTPKADKLKKIAEFLDVSMEYLMTGEERPEGNQKPSLSPADMILVEAYHRADVGTQESVCKLLDIKRDSMLSEEVG